MSPTALVLGAGVSGLTTALVLQDAGWDVAVRAEDMPGDTTSAVAAAMWYPYRAYPRDRVLDWGRRALSVFAELSEDAETGVTMRSGVELFRDPDPAPWWAEAVPDVREVAADDVPYGYAAGLAFTVPVVEMPVYLAFLRERLESGGGRLERGAVHDLADVADVADAIVNCTGLGARYLAGDDSLTPIRGQVVRVANPGIDRFLLDEQHPEGVTYVIPRRRDCVLGGTSEPGEWSTTLDPSATRAILDRCSALEPRLENAAVESVAVGLRPGRPEVRLEAEDVAGTPVVHNYGHGGAGVTLSWGCAQAAADLLVPERETR